MREEADKMLAELNMKKLQKLSSAKDAETTKTAEGKSTLKVFFGYSTS